MRLRDYNPLEEYIPVRTMVPMLPVPYPLDAIQHYAPEFAAVNHFIDNNFAPVVRDIIYYQTEDFLQSSFHVCVFGGVVTWALGKVLQNTNLCETINTNFFKARTIVGLGILTAGEIYQAVHNQQSLSDGFKAVASDVTAYTAGLVTFLHRPDMIKCFKQARSSLFGQNKPAYNNINLPD